MGVNRQLVCSFIALCSISSGTLCMADQKAPVPKRLDGQIWLKQADVPPSRGDRNGSNQLEPDGGPGFGWEMQN